MPMMAETFPPGATGTLPGTMPGGTMPGTIPSLTGANEQRRTVCLHIIRNFETMHD